MHRAGSVSRTIAALADTVIFACSSDLQMNITKSLMLVLPIVISTTHFCNAIQVGQGTSENWRWKCAVVTTTGSICDISLLSNDGIAVRIIGGSSLIGPSSYSIEFFL